jgi:hypothetical protein
LYGRRIFAAHVVDGRVLVAGAPSPACPEYAHIRKETTTIKLYGKHTLYQ